MSAIYPLNCFDVSLNHRAAAQIRESRALAAGPSPPHNVEDPRRKAISEFLSERGKATNLASAWQALARA